MESCGAELAEDAVVPEQLSKLMEHVAENMEAHARWVGTGTPAAERENESLLDLAASYREISNAALRAATKMRGLRNLAAAPHDPQQWNQERFAQWMQTKIELQRAFAQLLLEHAETSERVLRQ